MKLYTKQEKKLSGSFWEINILSEKLTTTTTTDDRRRRRTTDESALEKLRCLLAGGAKKVIRPFLRNQPFKWKVDRRHTTDDDRRRTTDESALEKLRCHSADGAKNARHWENTHNYLFIAEFRKREIEREENKQYDLRDTADFNYKWQISIDWLLIMPSLFNREYPVGLKLCRTTPADPRIIFGKNRPKLILLAKFDTTMPYMVKFAKLTIH